MFQTIKSLIAPAVALVAGVLTASGVVAVGPEEQAALVENAGLVVSGLAGLWLTARGINARRNKSNG